ncbi:13540_t:CDS:2 [Entrophospora sp. SA101]|nr:13540_t:CDS:2 [Entrophospora sp. SA101]
MTNIDVVNVAIVVGSLANAWGLLLESSTEYYPGPMVRSLLYQIRHHCKLQR